jgi:hypothetical protein
MAQYGAIAESAGSLTIAGPAYRSCSRREPHFTCGRLNSGVAFCVSGDACAPIAAHQFNSMDQEFDKRKPFDEAASHYEAVKRTPLNGAINWEVKMGFLIPICMIAAVVICAVMLTRL